MIITIDSVPQTIEVTTVLIATNNDKPQETILFRCFHCSKAVAQVQGSVSGIFAGIIPYSPIYVIHKCPECKRRYVFQQGVKKPVIDVVLANNHMTMYPFCCIICRRPLFRYNMNKLELPPLWRVADWPQVVECLTPRCLLKYNVRDILE